MSNTFVAILMGSESDVDTLEGAFATLRSLDVPFEARILSAHRTPQDTAAYVKDAQQRGAAVFIAAAGLAAHLAGAVAANTVRPVIGIPLNAGTLGGFDALLATVQMPGGTPVACTSIGSAGAKNAAFLAAQIIATNDTALQQRIIDQREAKQSAIKQADARLQSKLEKDFVGS